MSTTLDTFVGKPIKDICGKYDNASEKNNCAHFVGHALEFRLSGAALCSNVAGSLYGYADRARGFCIRVDQIYNSLSNRGLWPAVQPISPCIAVATIQSNLTDSGSCLIGDNPRKHIGVFTAGLIYNYSNTQKKVIKSSIAHFKHLYGQHTILLKADLP